MLTVSDIWPYITFLVGIIIMVIKHELGQQSKLTIINSTSETQNKTIASLQRTVQANQELIDSNDEKIKVLEQELERQTDLIDQFGKQCQYLAFQIATFEAVRDEYISRNKLLGHVDTEKDS
jgi:peptidoglycan hydrolase CwlO-like protein